MKSFMFCLLSLVLLASCGKDNESGKSNNGLYPGGYGNPYTQLPGYGSINSPYSTPYSNGNFAVNQIFQYHPCTVTPGLPQARATVQIPVNISPRHMSASDIYVGVTSVGDVAVLAGQNSSIAMLVGYICQRNTLPLQLNSATLIESIAYGASTQCIFKQLTRATVGIPGLPTPLFFRPLEGGTSTSNFPQIVRFPFCQ